MPKTHLDPDALLEKIHFRAGIVRIVEDRRLGVPAISGKSLHQPWKSGPLGPR